MNFDTWFYSQSKLVQMLLLIIPFVGWVIDALMRWSIYTRVHTDQNLVIAILYTIFGQYWILPVLDAIWIAVYGKLLFE